MTRLNTRREPRNIILNTKECRLIILVYFNNKNAIYTMNLTTIMKTLPHYHTHKFTLITKKSYIKLEEII